MAVAAMAIALIASDQADQLPPLLEPLLTGEWELGQEIATMWLDAVRGQLIPEFTTAAQRFLLGDEPHSLWAAEALAKTGHRDRALYYLRNAVARGFVNVTFMEQRSRWLASLREDPEFKALMTEARALQVTLLAELQVAAPQPGR